MREWVLSRGPGPGPASPWVIGRLPGRREPCGGSAGRRSGRPRPVGGAPGGPRTGRRASRHSRMPAVSAKSRPLRALPSVESLLSGPVLAALQLRVPRLLVREAARAELAAERALARRGGAAPPTAEDLAGR